MNTTLAERLKIAMAGPPKVTQAALARACGVKPPSINDWCSGKTKALTAGNLLKAAAKLGVRPRWLAEGIGPKNLDDEYVLPRIGAEPAAPPFADSIVTTTVRGRARSTLESVPEHLLNEAVAHMEWLIEREKKIDSLRGEGRAISGHS